MVYPNSGYYLVSVYTSLEVLGPMNKKSRRHRQLALQSVLREAREKAGFRQEDLASALGRPQSFVSKYESGERRLDVIEMQEISAALGISLSDLIVLFEAQATGWGQ